MIEKQKYHRKFSVIWELFLIVTIVMGSGYSTFSKKILDVVSA